MPCERARKIQDNRQYLAHQGMTSMPLDSASRLLGQGTNISAASQLIFSLLPSLETHYNKAIKCLQLSYLRDWTGDHMAPASTELVWSFPIDE